VKLNKNDNKEKEGRTANKGEKREKNIANKEQQKLLRKGNEEDMHKQLLLAQSFHKLSGT
jgi:hypothetical protein